MFRILLADDEGIMLESLKHIIATSFGSECDIRCVKTGRAVVEMAESFHPDIAFVDIHMPGLSGIQAIQEIRKVNNEMIIIIITAYDKFAYAKEAVNLGVMEYLTKPISNKKVILDVCMKAMQRVEEARQKRSDDLKIRERLEIVVPMIESGFIYSMLQDDGAADSSGYEELLGIRDNYGFCLVLEFGDRDESGRLTNVIGSSVKANKYYQAMREIVRDYFSCIAGPVMGNRVVLFVPSSEPVLKYEERVEVITRTRTMLQKLEEHIGSDFRSGIGSTKTLGNAKESYGEALRALRESVSHVVHITDIPSRQDDVAGEYPKELENSYYERGLKADSEGTAACGAELFSCMQGRYDCREDLEAKVLELIMQLEYRICAKDGTEFGLKPRGSYIREIKEASDSDKLCRWFLEKTREICQCAGTEKKKEMEYLVDTVRKYIDENYQKDISLDEISRMVNISPYYFSKLFKQGTGENFIEYLTRTRMRQACVCLRNPDYSIKQICAMVGYSDPNYFSRIFKKYEGVNPSEYRERLENGTGRG